MTDNMTKLPGVPSSDQAKPGMAFFEGTGPFARTCGECAQRARWGDCRAYRKMVGRKGPVVQPGWKACKYFVER